MPSGVLPELMCCGLPTQFLEQRSQRVQFGTEAAPVAGPQTIDGPIIVPGCLTGSIVWVVRGRWSDASRHGGGGGFPEQRGQGGGERLLPHHTGTISRDHPLEFRQLARLRAEIQRRHI